jgi:hypothetical protein
VVQHTRKGAELQHSPSRAHRRRSTGNANTAASKEAAENLEKRANGDICEDGTTLALSAPDPHKRSAGKAPVSLLESLAPDRSSSSCVVQPPVA